MNPSVSNDVKFGRTPKIVSVAAQLIPYGSIVWLVSSGKALAQWNYQEFNSGSITAPNTVDGNYVPFTVTLTVSAASPNPVVIWFELLDCGFIRTARKGCSLALGFCRRSVTVMETLRS